MNTLKLYVKTYNRRSDGKPWGKASCLGKYLPKTAIDHGDKIDDKTYYNVYLVGGEFPAGKDGKYLVYFDTAWLDLRDDHKNTIHLKGPNGAGCVYEFLEPSKLKAKTEEVGLQTNGALD